MSKSGGDGGGIFGQKANTDVTNGKRGGTDTGLDGVTGGSLVGEAKHGSGETASATVDLVEAVYDDAGLNPGPTALADEIDSFRSLGTSDSSDGGAAEVSSSGFMARAGMTGFRDHFTRAA